MPLSWHDRHAVNLIEDPEKQAFYRSIIADRKPYFMRYIYPDLMKQYNKYIRNTNKNAMREFHMSVKELLEIPEADRTPEQTEFLYYYQKQMPVGTHDCVMNRICRRFENEFSGYLQRHNKRTTFDYRIMKSGADYTQYQYNIILKLYHEYNRRIKNYAVFANYERVDEYDSYARSMEIQSEFVRSCEAVCPNTADLCDIILDICYRRKSTKRFAWNICGDQIIRNLLRRQNGRIQIPVLDENGELYFKGNRFTVVSKQIGVSEWELF